MPLFHSLIDSLAEDRRWVILDLGAARPQTIELLSRFRCRLDIAALEEAVVAWLDRKDESAATPDPVESLRSMPCSEPVDVVLAWDYLNYLNRQQITALMTALTIRCRPGAIVHALIEYRRSAMPSRPGLFAPLDEGRLIELSAERPERAATRYSTEDLDRCSPGFAIERLCLLSCGMQEYLFRLRPPVRASR